MNKPYFDTPKQVMFHDIDNPQNWLRGIAYKDEIICGCCGGVFEISEICEMSEGYVDQAIYEYDYWVDLSDEIGSELPEGLTDMIDEHGDYRIIEESAQEAEEYEQYAFVLEEEEADASDVYAYEKADAEAEMAMFANTWVDGIAMPEA